MLGQVKIRHILLEMHMSFLLSCIQGVFNVNDLNWELSFSLMPTCFDSLQNRLIHCTTRRLVDWLLPSHKRTYFLETFASSNVTRYCPKPTVAVVCIICYTNLISYKCLYQDLPQGRCWDYTLVFCYQRMEDELKMWPLRITEE